VSGAVGKGVGRAVSLTVIILPYSQPARAESAKRADAGAELAGHCGRSARSVRACLRGGHIQLRKVSVINSVSKDLPVKAALQFPYLMVSAINKP
jgi:hypothetical protein